jgi:hypothetical protein
LCSNPPAGSMPEQLCTSTGNISPGNKLRLWTEQLNLICSNVNP